MTSSIYSIKMVLKMATVMSLQQIAEKERKREDAALAADW